MYVNESFGEFGEFGTCLGLLDRRGRSSLSDLIPTFCLHSCGQRNLCSHNSRLIAPT